MQPTKREQRVIANSLLIVRTGLDGSLVEPADFQTALIDLGQTRPDIVLALAKEQAEMLGLVT